jgi:ABC-2 type transport system ATP-binding protein
MLSIIDLQKRFGAVLALDGLSFDVRPGRILGFLGPNGAGKTTAMRCIFGLVVPEAGRVTWNGLPVGAREQLRFGYMPEERGLYPKMRVAEQISYFARLSGLTSQEAAEATRDWLERLGLSDRAQDKLEELSHGNQQRVQLAASLVHGPDVAVLDEPFSGLDPIAMETMAHSLRDLATHGVAIVFSSHQLDLVEDICQDVLIINRGRSVLSGNVRELRNQSSVRHLEIDVDGTAWHADVPGVEVLERNGRLRYVVDRTTEIGSLLEAAARDGEVTRFTFEPPSLSDLFREAVST